MITRTFKLCLNAGTGSAPFINVSQTDRDETWLFELYTETGERYIPSSGAIIGIKADGHGIANTGTVDSEGRVVITETEQMTAAAGRSIFELSIDGLTHGTANFIVNVEKKPIDGAIMSDSDLSLISEAVDSAAVIVEVIGDSDPSEVIGEHVDAWLDAHPEATTTVQDGAITAPKINNSLWDKILVNEEASGAVASFDDGADDVPVKSLKVSIDPVQSGSGDPSPTNIRPISGHTSATVTRTGKNLLKPTLYNGQWGSTGGFASSANRITNTLDNTGFTDTPFLKAGTYTLSVANLQWCTAMTKDANGNIIDNFATSWHTLPFTFTLTADGYFIFTARRNDNADISSSDYIGQVEIGSTATAYEPYDGNTYITALGQTVYGGTLDVVTGVLTVTWTSRTINGSESWARENGSATHYKYYINANDIGKPIGNNYKAEGTIICDKLITAVNSFDYTTDSIAVTAWANHPVDSNYLYLIVNNAAMGFDTADGLKAWLASNPLQVAYKLATPQTINLTPTQVKTLLGYNNISSSGTVDVIYHADTKLYVDKMTNVDNAIIAPTEEGFTATRNYTVNDLLIVADTLYKVTANIASGSAITPNSNVTATTLSTLIKALS